MRVLLAGDVSHSHLEVAVVVSLDEGVDGADTAVGLGGVVGGGLMVGRGRGAV